MMHHDAPWCTPRLTVSRRQEVTSKGTRHKYTRCIKVEILTSKGDVLVQHRRLGAGTTKKKEATANNKDGATKKARFAPGINNGGTHNGSSNNGSSNNAASHKSTSLIDSATSVTRLLQSASAGGKERKGGERGRKRQREAGEQSLGEQSVDTSDVDKSVVAHSLLANAANTAKQRAQEQAELQQGQQLQQKQVHIYVYVHTYTYIQIDVGACICHIIRINTYTYMCVYIILVHEYMYQDF